MKTCDLSLLHEAVRNPLLTVDDLVEVARDAETIIRRATPPRALPPLECEYGLFDVRTIDLAPYHGLAIIATDAQPVQCEAIWMQRELIRYQATVDSAVARVNSVVEIRFPKLGQHGQTNDTPRLDRWRRHNQRMVKRYLDVYFDNQLPLIEHHWEYAVLLSLRGELRRLANTERDVSEVNRLLTAVDGRPQDRSKYRDAAGMLYLRRR